MPWNQLTEFLVKRGLSMTGYPEIPFPGGIVEDDVKGKRKKNTDTTKQGIKDIGTANVRILYDAFKTKTIALVPKDKAGMESWLSYP